MRYLIHFCIWKHYSLAISLYQRADNTLCSEWYLFVAVHHLFIYINAYDLYFLPSPVSPSPTALFLLQMFVSIISGKILSVRYLVDVNWMWPCKLYLSHQTRQCVTEKRRRRKFLLLNHEIGYCFSYSSLSTSSLHSKEKKSWHARFSNHIFLQQ